MKTNFKFLAIIFAIVAAGFYGLSTPFSKLLLTNVGPTMLAAFLYLGAAVGVGFLYLFHFKKEKKEERLTVKDLPYTIMMILLDIIAPIFLMIGVNNSSSSSASLLSNFEIVATSLIAKIIFKEKISNKLWFAITFIISSSIVLSLNSISDFKISSGSLFVVLATCCWGLENNCTRKISDKSTYQIVLLKGFFTFAGSFIVSNVIGEELPKTKYILLTMLLGFIAYGLSIFLYIRAQRILKAAKTSSYYALAPFIGSFLSFLLLKEKLTANYLVGLLLMVIGTIIVVIDTLSTEDN